jgi:hypothetical protein
MPAEVAARPGLWLNMRPMATTTETSSDVGFTPVEIASYLPAGWTLAAEPAPRWDDDKGVYRCTVVDGCDLDWPLVVAKKDVDAHGRIDALKRAIDHLDRKRFKSWL